MTHKKLGPIKKRLRTYDVVELRALLIFIQTMLASMGHPIRAGAGRGRRHGAKKKAAKKGHKTRHLRPGVHTVRIGHVLRKVRVLHSGKWQFMKG